MTDFDQHFLINMDVVNASIQAAQLKKQDIVLEIGPGKGILTNELAKHCHKVIAIEIDEHLKKELACLPKNVELIFGNALELISPSTDLKFNKIVANIPYSISEPLLRKLLKLHLDCAVLLVSKSFYYLLSDKESKWSTIINLFFQLEKVQDVSKTLFNPKPKTDSVLMKLNPRTSALTAAEQLLKEIVLQDDKKLKNALIYALLRVKSLTKKQTKEVIEQLDLDKNWLNKRVDHLSNFQFNSLAEIIASKI
jgi:16S rRNA (adenine1518-N6/adenine1519-N6)-dimethyltransferase